MPAVVHNVKKEYNGKERQGKGRERKGRKKCDIGIEEDSGIWSGHSDQ